MKLAHIISASVLSLTLVGCASSPGVVGTWNGRGADAKAPFTFGSVSFVGDHTFTAEARYSGDVKVQSGTWSAKGDELVLNSDKTVRKYTYKLKNGALVVTDPKSGHSITLDRMAK